MKTNQLFSGLLLAASIFMGHAQVTNIHTADFSSLGYNAGTTSTPYSTYYGPSAGKNSTSGSANSFFGYFAGSKTTGAGDTFIGYNAGYQNTAGAYNTFLGHYCGVANTTGKNNVYVGSNSGKDSNGDYNTFVGYSAGNVVLTGAYNSYFGASSGAAASGSYNACIGYNSGGSADGSYNVFLGYRAGFNTTASNLLYIENSSNAVPLIWGDFSNDLVKLNGKVGIGLNADAFPTGSAGVDVTNYKLIVKGGILAHEVRVATTWADYVFENNYALPSLQEVACYIDENGHLPNMPSAAQVEEDGIEVGQMAKMQQEKIEELTLYAIQQDKKIDAQEKTINSLEEKMAKMQETINTLLEKTK